MPLALIAIASHLDNERFEPIIIDGRISEDPVAELLEHLPSAVCVGVTCLTGAPLHDALQVSQSIKEHFPDTPVVWGGWHPSLFPTQPLDELNCVDVTVQGQGEQTFKDLVEAFASPGNSLKEIDGIAFKDQNGEIVRNKPRAMEPIGSFCEPDYSLIDVPAYFARKERKQLDFITSTGCYFRCEFCADPFVFNRKFTSLTPESIFKQLEALHKQYGFEDLNFQDETFFTYRHDILKMAQLFIDSEMEFTWAATMRADQGSRMTEEEFELLKKSGLRRLLIGVESGSQEMMDWLKKDIKMEQVWLCADRCKRLNIDVIFPFIVGFPEETDESVASTRAMIKKLRQMSSGFDTPVFYFKPYPGSGITNRVSKEGFELPKSTLEWSEFDYIGSHGPWVSREKYRDIERLKFYLKLAYKQLPMAMKPLQWFAKFRLRTDWFGMPLEKLVFQKLYDTRRLS